MRTKDAKTVDLAHRVRRAVMMSMAMTGERYLTANGAALYSHDDYDDAMDALNELTRRALSLPVDLPEPPPGRVIRPH
jgi:hypothetical protein